MDSQPSNDAEGSVYLNLASSFTVDDQEDGQGVSNVTVNSVQLRSRVTQEDCSWCLSDDEPLQASKQLFKQPGQEDVSWCHSDLEPLSATIKAARWSCSDDEPLIKSKRLDISDLTTTENESDNDNIIKDPTYSPFTKLPQADVVPTSSNEDESDENMPLLSLTRQKRKHTLSKFSNIELAKAVSKQEMKRHQREQEVHRSRLQNLLSANGLYSVEVAADGNCFFEAVSMHLNITALDLRTQICNYLEDKFATYICFLTTDEDDENERYLKYFQNVEQLRSPGIWSNDAADLLPKALADCIKRPVIIYSSNLLHYETILYPDTQAGDTSVDQSPIILSLLETEAQHYNAVFPFPPATRSSGTPGDSGPVTSEAAEDTVPGTSKTQEDTMYETSGGNDTTNSPVIEQMSPPNTPQTPRSRQTSSFSPLHSTPKPQTPRKQGKFKTPPQKKLFRKKLAMPDTWKKNSRKSLRVQGKEYVSETGKIVPAKKIKPIDCSKCRFKCSRVSESERQALFETFYSLGDCEKQKSFICSNVEEKNTKTLLGEDNKPISKKRSLSRGFSFNVDGERKRVCKKFFLATLSVSESYVDHAMRNSQHGVFKRDQRCKTAPHNKTPNEIIARAKAHIESFPTVESHYTRKDSQRSYLSSELSIRKMFELHKQECQMEGKNHVSERTYRRIFSENYNLSFHHPKKDQCAQCTITSIKEKQGTLSEAEKESQVKHLQRRDNARTEKQNDKDTAKKDRKKHVITMDMQAVLQAPCGLVSQLYYKRKLCVYNFTTYSLADGTGKCFTWNETEGKRGACEIATCVSLYLSALPDHVQEVVIFSDCCSGQNRNQYLVTALMHILKTKPTIHKITQKFLETGHTQMECDSMHSAITCAKKATPIYTPSHWDTVLRLARRNKPYTVVPLKHTDFYDFKKVASTRVRNTKTNIKGQRVNWLKIKCIEFNKGEEDIMLYKYNFQEGYHAIRLVGSSGKRHENKKHEAKDLPRLYKHKLPISEAKKRDLVSLCRSNIIPEEHHSFYEALPTSSAAADTLPELDVNDSDEDTD